MSKPVTGQTTFGANTSGTTTQLDNNFLLAYAALNDFNTYGNYLVDAGAANAYVVTLAASLTGTLSAGLSVQFKAAAANTGASTLAFNGGAAKNILNANGSALVAGQIPMNGIINVMYDGTQFQLLSVNGVSTSAAKNIAVNGSFAVNQIVTPTTTDNSYPFDGWRLLLGAANAATIVQDTADVPTGAGYAAKMIVGAGNNNKFGIFCPIENKDILYLRGGVASIVVPLKATAALTNTRIGILQWTSTADSISATPISAWNVAGTNPTLIANWAFANTPAALAVTTAWADYTIENVAISASATNLGILIWSDTKTNTQTTDILRAGGYVTFCQGASAPAPQVAPFDVELRKSRRYCRKTFLYATAPAQNAGVGTGELFWQAINGGATTNNIELQFGEPMRVAPTATLYNPSAGNAQVRDTVNNVDCSGSAVSIISEWNLNISALGNGASTSGAGMRVHAFLDARL